MSSGFGASRLNRSHLFEVINGVPHFDGEPLRGVTKYTLTEEIGSKSIVTISFIVNTRPDLEPQRSMPDPHTDPHRDQHETTRKGG